MLYSLVFDSPTRLRKFEDTLRIDKDIYSWTNSVLLNSRRTTRHKLVPPHT